MYLNFLNGIPATEEKCKASTYCNDETHFLSSVSVYPLVEIEEDKNVNVDETEKARRRKRRGGGRGRVKEEVLLATVYKAK